MKGRNVDQRTFTTWQEKQQGIFRDRKVDQGAFDSMKAGHSTLKVGKWTKEPFITRQEKQGVFRNRNVDQGAFKDKIVDQIALRGKTSG